jgi:hypothetical protein
MPNHVDRIAPFLAAALLGYLAYSVVAVESAPAPAGKEPPAITKKMLQPELITPRDQGSAAGRDPFEVAWASYLQQVDPNAPVKDKAKPPAPKPESPAPKPESPAPKDAAAAAEEDPEVTADETSPGQEPAAPRPVEPPALPSGVTSICVSGTQRMAVIDGKVYRPGDLLNGKDPARCWVVESVGDNTVVLRFGSARHTLSIVRSGPEAPGRTPAAGGTQ